jgi:aspartyl-tRNA(Asn)/glutamyl-tRNA(Gln) amidotransferase subunit C
MAAELDVRYVARLARLDLTDDEASHFQTQLTDVLGYIAALDRLDVTGLEPTVHAEEAETVSRPDVARLGFSAAEALANAPAANAGLFLTPRVVE